MTSYLLKKKRKIIHSKSSMGTPDNRENTAAEEPEISIVSKRKQLKRPEDRAYIF
jgi:hypothetical protein